MTSLSSEGSGRDRIVNPIIAEILAHDEAQNRDMMAYWTARTIGAAAVGDKYAIRLVRLAAKCHADFERTARSAPTETRGET